MQSQTERKDKERKEKKTRQKIGKGFRDVKIKET